MGWLCGLGCLGWVVRLGWLCMSFLSGAGWLRLNAVGIAVDMLLFYFSFEFVWGLLWVLLF